MNKIKFEKKIILMCGNIGSGKSTTVKRFVKQGYVCVCPDALRFMFGNGNYVFNVQIESVIHKAVYSMVKALMKHNASLIVDEVFASKWMRSPFIKLAKKNKYKIYVYVMPRLTKEESVNRRMKNNHYKNSLSKKRSRNIWNYVWDRFDYKWEQPSKEEGFDRIIKGVKRRK